MAAPAETRRTTNGEYGFLAALVILAMIVGLGAYAFFMQTTEGHFLTNLTNASPWGLYIVGLVFFIGAAAGSTVVGLMVHAFGRRDYARLGTRALLIGLLSLLGAVLFTMVDVGSIPRMLQLPWVYHNPTSMFFYTSISYYIFGLTLLGELYYTIKLTRGKSTARDKRIAKWLSILAVPFALVILVGTDGVLFAVVKAREFWNNPLLPPHFAVVAVVSGLAIMLLVAIAMNKLRGREIVSRATLAHMGVLLGFFIVAAAFMDFFDFLVFTYSDNPTGAAVWDVIWGPQLGFSVVHIAGYAIALLLLVLFRRRTTALAVAAALTLTALVAYRYNLVTVGFADPILPFQETKQYWPSRYEIALTLGIVALVTLGYLVLSRLLPMEEDENGTPRWEVGIFDEEKPRQPSEPAAVDG